MHNGGLPRQIGCRRRSGGVADHPEASCGSFYWADRIEAIGAACFVLDPMRFRIITDSWNKTDRQDARNMAKALWVFLVTGEFGIPTVYKPSEGIRTLRRLFTTYNLLNRQIRMLKNAIQAMLLDDGIVVTTSERSRLFTGRESVSDMIGERSLSPPILSAIEIQIDLLRRITESKVALAKRIVIASAPLAEQIKLLVTILRDHSNHRRGVPGGHWRRAAVQESATHERLPWTGTTVSRQRREGRVVCTNVGCDVRQALRRSPIDHRRPGLPAAARTSHGLSSLHFTLFASFDPWRSSLGLSVTRHPSSSRRGEDRRAFGL